MSGAIERCSCTFSQAVLDRDELIGRRLRSLAETLCDGSLTPLLTHLARAKDLTDEDRLALRAIVDEADSDSGTDRVDRGKDSVISVPGASPRRLALARREVGGNERPLTTTMNTAWRLTLHGIARTCSA